MKKSGKASRFFGRVLFAVYLFLTFYFLFFSEKLDRTMVSDEYRYNLVLFNEIKRFWSMKEAYGWSTTVVNLLGNIVCFMPFGFLLPTISKRKNNNNFIVNMFVVTCFTFLFSTVVETIQLVTKVGAFDVDDIFLNTIGGILGYIVFKILKFLRKNRN